MTNFDFLKNFNNELYEIGMKLEEDVITSPRAVTADATLFLESLVKDIYKQSNNKLENNLISFYKKIDNIYRLGEITYIYKNKLQEAYNLRNRIHKKNLNTDDEKKLAFDLHKRLFYIAKKYFRDYCENQRFIKIPDYKKPSVSDIHFKNCIICGHINRKSSSNMCENCNQKVENANLMLTIKNKFEDIPFTRQDLMDCGIDESKAILFLMDLSQYGAVKNKGDYYILNPKNFKNYLDEIENYIQIGSLITRFYKNEITGGEILNTPQYHLGSENEKPFREFYKLVNSKIESDFEENLLKYKDINKSKKFSFISDLNLKKWYYNQKEMFNKGILNDAFILYNEILINEFFKYKKKTLEDDESLLKYLGISNQMYSFWQHQFLGGRFIKKNMTVKKDLILREIKKDKSLKEVLFLAEISKEDFDKMYITSKQENDEFYNKFNKEYTLKRQKLLIKHLKKHKLNKAISLCKITRSEFLQWYYQGDKELSDFYVKTTRLLMDKYLNYRQNNWNKKDILKEINVSKDMFKTWSKHMDSYLFMEFELKNKEITSSLIKRGLIINNIREGKSKEEAIFSANLTPKEFLEIYNTSKKEHTEFYLRFDYEYEKSRKKQFIKHIQSYDFYNAIQKSEISQTEFNEWYFKDQDKFLSSGNTSAFYLTTTNELMDKYLKARTAGKNKPDAAKSVGLSNNAINKWLNHTEFDLFNEFKIKNDDVIIGLIIKGFGDKKSKLEVSDIYDIPVKLIEDYIEFGRNGISRYEEISDLYENNVIPYHLEIFLKNFKSKSYYISLKQAKLTKEEVNYYYNLGKQKNNKFKYFYDNYMDIKIELYVNDILSGKSHKIALKNSNLSKSEYEKFHNKLDDLILEGRFNLIDSGLKKNKITGVKLSKIAGISIDEIYNWYFKGRDGNKKYEDFAKEFELKVILPKIIAYKKAVNIGISEKWLKKQLKKDLGLQDYKRWEKFDFFSYDDSDFMNISESDLDEFKMFNIIKKSKILNVSNMDDNDESLDVIKKSFRDKSEPNSVIQLTTINRK